MNYSAEELVSVIKACSKSGVSSLKVGEMELIFGKKPEEEEFLAPVVNKVVPSSEIESEIREIDQVDELLVKEQRQVEMLLSDPERYEELLAKEGLMPFGLSDDGQDSSGLGDGL